MISVSGMSTSLALKIVDSTGEKERTMIRDAPQHEREIDYFLENIGSVTTVEELTDDYRLYSFVMKAHDLEDQIFGKAMMEKIMQSNVEEKDALVNRLTDPRFRTLYDSMGFGAEGVGNINTALGDWQQGIVNRYVNTQYQNEKAEENDAVGTILKLRDVVGNINSPFDILRDKELTGFFQTVLGLPSSISALDIDRQADMLRGKLDFDTLKDPEAVEKLIGKYAAISDANSRTAAAQSGAVHMLNAAANARLNGGSFVPVTLDISAITGFGRY